MTRLFHITTLTALFVATSLQASHAACRLALALALDVSGSVDQQEYRLQLDGLATALDDPDVTAAIFAVPDAPVAIAVYEWSASRYQRIIQDWTLLQDPATLSDVTASLRQHQREPAPEATGLGQALRFAAAMFQRGPYCEQFTLDVSGDGINNDWPEPTFPRERGEIAGFRINGLVIGAPENTKGTSADELAAYYRARVIQGTGAFVEKATGFQDYARAMKKKLLRELTALPMGNLFPGQPERIVPTSLASGTDAD